MKKWKMKIIKIEMELIIYNTINQKKSWKLQMKEKFKESCKKSWMNWRLYNIKTKYINSMIIESCLIMRKVNWKLNNKDKMNLEKAMCDQLTKASINNWSTVVMIMKKKKIWWIIKITKEIFFKWLTSLWDCLKSISLLILIIKIKIKADLNNLDFQYQNFKQIKFKLSEMLPKYQHRQVSP